MRRGEGEVLVCVFFGESRFFVWCLFWEGERGGKWGGRGVWFGVEWGICDLGTKGSKIIK